MTFPFRAHFGVDDRGATAVEFAFVALPFMALLFAILETAIIFAAGEILQTTVTDASRLIMTGKVKSADKTAFKSKMCERMISMFDCESQLSVDVRSLKTLNGVGRANPYVDGKYDTSRWGYETGGSGAVVIVTASYPWPTFMDIAGFNLAEGTTRQRILTGTAIFKNEAY